MNATTVPIYDRYVKNPLTHVKLAIRLLNLWYIVLERQDPYIFNDEYLINQLRTLINIKPNHDKLLKIGQELAQSLCKHTQHLNKKTEA